MAVLEVEGLKVSFSRASGFAERPRPVAIVKGVSFSLLRGRTLGIVGESGCGKSTLAQALVGLVVASAGSIRYAGEALADLARRPAQLVFQDPQSAFNPRRRVWQIIAEPLEISQNPGAMRLRERALELALQVGLSVEQMDRFPHEFSGGQRQRIAIARALATSPDVLILDEPTSALDVSIQAQVLNLLLRLQRETGIAYLFISHDVSVIRHMADDVAVMHEGKFIEIGPALEILDRPQQAYTQKLIAAAPSLKSTCIKAITS